jgi:type III pantothenate kinase
LPNDQPQQWQAAWDRWNPGSARPSRCAVSSVNPPVADQLQAFLESQRGVTSTWFRSAAEVGVPNEVIGAETGGADRALAVAAAISLAPAGRPGLVVSCGTAITVERVSRSGVWQGGAIAPGLTLCARALHDHTAQLPLVMIREPPPAWGAATAPALEAGVFWGTVGACRELIARQTAELGNDRWLIWTGGDAALLAPAVTGATARIEPDLVLIGLARTLFPSGQHRDASSHDQ